MKLHRYPRCLQFFLLFPLAAVLASQSSLAHSTYYWDNNGGTAGFGTAAGTWAVPTTGNATQGWSTDGAGTIAVSGTVDSGNISFGSASVAIILSGGIINLTNISNHL